MLSQTGRVNETGKQDYVQNAQHDLSILALQHLKGYADVSHIWKLIPAARRTHNTSIMISFCKWIFCKTAVLYSVKQIIQSVQHVDFLNFKPSDTYE